MAGVGEDRPDRRVWRAAVLLGLALLAGAFALAVLYSLCCGFCPCHEHQGRLVLVPATSRDVWISLDAARTSPTARLASPTSPGAATLPPSPSMRSCPRRWSPPATVLLGPFAVGLAVPCCTI
jgi:hypothetical protein